MFSPRDHVRAALIALHLLAIGLMAIPAPAGMTHKELDYPEVRDSLQPFAQLIGRDANDEAFIEEVYGLTNGVLEARDTVLSPFEPYYKAVGTRQSWRMFANVNDKPARVEILIDHGDGSFEELYVARDPEHAWRRAQFDHERFRAFMNDYSWHRDRRSWRLFNAWVAKQAAADFPEAARLRLRVRYMPILSPEKMGEARERPKGKVFWTITHDLAEVRAAGNAYEVTQ